MIRNWKKYNKDMLISIKTLSTIAGFNTTRTALLLADLIKRGRVMAVSTTGTTGYLLV